MQVRAANAVLPMGCHSVLHILLLLFFFFLPPPDITGACCFHRNFWPDYLYSKFIFFNTCSSRYWKKFCYLRLAKLTTQRQQQRTILGFEKASPQSSGLTRIGQFSAIEMPLFSSFFFFFSLSFFFLFSPMIFFWCVSKSQHWKGQQIGPFLFSWKALSQPDLCPPEGQRSKVQL